MQVAEYQNTITLFLAWWREKNKCNLVTHSSLRTRALQDLYSPMSSDVKTAARSQGNVKDKDRAVAG